MGAGEVESEGKRLFFRHKWPPGRDCHRYLAARQEREVATIKGGIRVEGNFRDSCQPFQRMVGPWALEPRTSKVSSLLYPVLQRLTGRRGAAKYL